MQCIETLQVQTVRQYKNSKNIFQKKTSAVRMRIRCSLHATVNAVGNGRVTRQGPMEEANVRGLSALCQWNVLSRTLQKVLNFFRCRSRSAAVGGV